MPLSRVRAGRDRTFGITARSSYNLYPELSVIPTVLESIEVWHLDRANVVFLLHSRCNHSAKEDTQTERVRIPEKSQSVER